MSSAKEYTLIMLDGSIHKIPATSRSGDQLEDYVRSLENANFRDIMNVAMAEGPDGQCVCVHPDVPMEPGSGYS